MGGEPANNQPSSVRSDWITRTPKWVLLGGFWAAQGIALYLVQALIYESQNGIDVTIDSTGGFRGILPEGIFGQWPSFENYTNLLIDSEFAIMMGMTIAALTIAQMIFLLPVRRPGLMGNRGHGLKRSLYIAGFVIGGLTLAAVMAIGEYLDTVHKMDFGFIDQFPGGAYFGVGIVVALGWSIATPMLFHFTRPGRKEAVLARLSKKLFLGTIIEVALLIPLDVMVRRKTSCYCWAGSYWALTLCGFIGVFALGPAVFLPILAKRRKTWYAGHCGVCSYDMSGTPDALRCPECGTGWKNVRSRTAIETQ